MYGLSDQSGVCVDCGQSGRLPDVRWVYGLSDLSGGCMDCLISQVGVWTVLTYRRGQSSNCREGSFRHLMAWCLFAQNPITEDRLYDQMGLVASAMAFSWSKWNSEVETDSVVVQGAEALQDEPLLEVSMPF